MIVVTARPTDPAAAQLFASLLANVYSSAPNLGDAGKNISDAVRANGWDVERVGNVLAGSGGFAATTGGYWQVLAEAASKNTRSAAMLGSAVSLVGNLVVLTDDY